MRKAKKITLNDPIYGFVEVPFPLLLEIINHPYFQRLRRIRQLGMTQMVYPGAIHTRFQHAIGAMHLTHLAVQTLRAKGQEITEEEHFSVCAAVLLHDIGHAPFSHSLEQQLVLVHHEQLSKLFIQAMNNEFKGKLQMALDIFLNRYKKKFLCQLVSGQLDMDRLDYLNRDSFFCGVTEGAISSDRIIKMLDIVDGELAIEAKGIYSVEHFIIARRLMYWQVYLHKTVLGSENLLVKILLRAREIASSSGDIDASPPLLTFISRSYKEKDFTNNPELLALYSELDDYDLYAAIKSWMYHPDYILAYLSRSLVDRKLYKTEILNDPASKKQIEDFEKRAMKQYGIEKKDCHYFAITGELNNKAYNPKSDRINILFKDGTKRDIAKASDYLSIHVLSKVVKKYFLSYPKEI